jgi:acetylornithine deacetylase/succinyl-diaminopimelate desuccinylase-like protein
MSALRDQVEGLVARFREPLLSSDARTLEDQVALAQIPSPTHREHARAAWVVAAFTAIGLHPRRDDVGNVVARVGDHAHAPPVVVCAHLDTVFPEVVAHRVSATGALLSGPGISDNARGLAGMLAIARALADRTIRTRHPILLAATVGEEGEGDLRGARHLFATEAAGAHAAFALDGAGDERIVTHALGTRRFRVTFRGPGGHSWAASDTPNPLHATAQLAVDLVRLPLRRTPRTTLAVTRIHGGDAVNAIPADATIDVEARSPLVRLLDEAEFDLHRLTDAALAAENTGRGDARQPLGVSIERISDRPAGVCPIDSDPVAAAVAATEAIGRRPEFAIASTDANVPLSLGIPAVSIGAGGRAGDTHTLGEWYENHDGALGLARALAAILATAGAV